MSFYVVLIHEDSTVPEVKQWGLQTSEDAKNRCKQFCLDFIKEEEGKKKLQNAWFEKGVIPSGEGFFLLETSHAIEIWEKVKTSWFGINSSEFEKVMTVTVARDSSNIRIVPNIKTPSGVKAPAPPPCPIPVKKTEIVQGNLDLTESRIFRQRRRLYNDNQFTESDTESDTDMGSDSDTDSDTDIDSESECATIEDID